MIFLLSASQDSGIEAKKTNYSSILRFVRLKLVPIKIKKTEALNTLLPRSNFDDFSWSNPKSTNDYVSHIILFILFHNTFYSCYQAALTNTYCVLFNAFVRNRCFFFAWPTGPDQPSFLILVQPSS